MAAIKSPYTILISINPLPLIRISGRAGTQYTAKISQHWFYMFKLYHKGFCQVGDSEAGNVLKIGCLATSAVHQPPSAANVCTPSYKCENPRWLTSRVTAFTRFSENLSKIQTHPRFSVDAHLWYHRCYGIRLKISRHLVLVFTKVGCPNCLPTCLLPRVVTTTAS